MVTRTQSRGSSDRNSAQINTHKRNELYLSIDYNPQGGQMILVSTALGYQHVLKNSVTAANNLNGTSMSNGVCGQHAPLKNRNDILRVSARPGTLQMLRLQHLICGKINIMQYLRIPSLVGLDLNYGKRDGVSRRRLQIPSFHILRSGLRA